MLELRAVIEWLVIYLALSIPFSALLKNEKTVRNIFDDHIKQAESEVTFRTPRFMGIDKFHVVRMAIDAVEKVRKAIRKEVSTRQRLRLKDDRFTLLKRNHELSDSEQDKLLAWTTHFPELGRAYQL